MAPLPTHPEDFPEGLPYIDPNDFSDDDLPMAEQDPVPSYLWSPTDPYYALRMDGGLSKAILHYYHGTKYDNESRDVQNDIVQQRSRGPFGFLDEWKWNVRRTFDLPAARVGMASPEPWNGRGDEEQLFFVLWLSGPDAPSTLDQRLAVAERCGLDANHIVMCYAAD